MNDQQPLRQGTPNQQQRQVQNLGPSRWLDADQARMSFEEEDQRWAAGEQLRDWLLLLGMLAGTALWTLIVFVLEPGLR